MVALAEPFPAQRYWLEYRVERRIEFPDYAGSALRGMFGHALRRISCVTAATTCDGCPLTRNCPYSMIFETPPPEHAQRVFTQAPHPYVIEPPPWGERVHDAGSTLRFQLVLIGPALAQMPLVLQAWRNALLNRVGPAHGSATLDSVGIEGCSTSLLGANGRLSDHAQVLPPASPMPPGPLQLELTTPLRLTRNGHTLRGPQIGAVEFLGALLRRATALELLLPPRTPTIDHRSLLQAAQRIELHKTCTWRDWTRRSSRQQQHMTVGGLVGHASLHGDRDDLALWWPLLHVGQWLHIGKLASFGLGQYRLVHH